jgi:hypothetical protein
MPSDRLIPLLERVRQSGPGAWTASCPTSAHKRGDRSRGLSIRETEEGVLLLKCFSGCTASEIVWAVGLELSDLFPPRPEGHGNRPKAPPVPWRDIFEGIQTDLTACFLAFSDLAAGKSFSPEDAAYIAGRAEDLGDQIRRARGG